MASSSEPKIYAFKAAAAMAAYVAVKTGADQDHVAICSAASDLSIGIIQNAPTAADGVAEVALPGGGAKAKLGAGGAAVGQMLVPDANGQLVVSTSNAARAIAVAMQTGVENDVIGVEVIAQII